MIKLDYTAVVVCDTEAEAEWTAARMAEAGYEVAMTGALGLTATLHQEYEVSNG